MRCAVLVRVIRSNFVNFLGDAVRGLLVACRCMRCLIWVLSCLCKSLDIKSITILIASKAVPEAHAWASCVDRQTDRLISIGCCQDGNLCTLLPNIYCHSNCTLHADLWPRWPTRMKEEFGWGEKLAILSSACYRMLLGSRIICSYLLAYKINVLRIFYHIISLIHIFEVTENL